MESKISLKDAEEFLYLLNRVDNLSNELEETLQGINDLNYVGEPCEVEFLDTSEGSVTNSVLKKVTSKLQLVQKKLS